MVNPIQTQVLDLIEERLALISVANGYYSTLERIERARLQPFKNRDMPAITYYSIGDTLDKNITNGVSVRVMNVVVEYYDLTRDEIFIDLANKLSSDIMIALERTVANPTVADAVSSRLGGKVGGLEVLTITPAAGSGQAPYCGSVVVLEITYRVARQDPFTLID